MPKDFLLRGAVFFDRDGTLTCDEGYTFRPEALRWLPGAVEAIRRCNDLGCLAIVVTNQSGVARGYYSEDDVRAFHAQMQGELGSQGAHVDAFYFCPYHGDGVVPEFAHANHPDRKPSPGMLRRALLEWPIDPSRSFLVGDTDADVAAAQAAGLAAWRVEPGGLLEAVERGLAETSVSGGLRSGAFVELSRRADQARAWLFDSALPLWWERGFDRAADCFHERLTLDGTPVVMARRIRVQARQTVVYARAGRLGWPGPWREAVEAGARVLLERALRGDGGPRFVLDPSGRPADDRRDLYVLSFVLLALAEAAQVLGDRPDLMAAAERLVEWLEAHWADPSGGFFEGDVEPIPPRRQNPHMHLFEAFLALYEATGEPTHLERASRLANLFGAKLFDARWGALPEYFDESWRPLTDAGGRFFEPGHHFEWSWLLHRWKRLGGGDMGEVAERLRLQAEIYGVNPQTGMIWDEVFLDGRIRVGTARLWPYTERMKANLVQVECTGDPRAAAAVLQSFDSLMAFCDTPASGTWRDRRTADGHFLEGDALASSFYHIVLGMHELIRVASGLRQAG